MRGKLSATCPLDCPDACRLLLSFEEGRFVKVEGDPQHPFTRGFACSKTYRYPERFYHSSRIMSPLKRVGPKGCGQFKPISWEQALDEIAAALRAILDRYGGEAVLPYHYAGTMGFYQRDHPTVFFRAIGATELDLTICATAGAEAWEKTYGWKVGTDPELIPNARYIILWGINAVSTNSHLLPWLKEARRRGAKILHIDPYFNRTSRFADEYIPIRPGSDAAAAYAIAHVIIEENLWDKAYLERAATGVEEFIQVARQWPPERAEKVTGVPAETLKRLAREFAQNQPAFIRVGYGMTRHPGGSSALRTVILLPALTGAWQYPGGGALLTTSGAFELNKTYLGGRHLLSGRHPHRGYFRPNSNARHVNMNQLAMALEELDDPPVKAIIIYNSNPAVVAPNSEGVRRGLLQEDRLMVVLEQVMTETAQLADYVLPATTFLEHADLYTSYGHYYLSWNEQLVKPLGEARSNMWVFQKLGWRLGIDEPTLYWSAEQLAESLLDSDSPLLEGITLEKLRQHGYMRLKLPSPFLPFRDGAPTPSGKIQFAPPPEVILSEVTDDYPLLLITPPAHHFLNSTYGCVEALARTEGGEPVIIMHPLDAERLGISDGQLVEITSKVGSIRRRVSVRPVPIPGVLVHEGTWWGTHAPDGKSVNAVTGEHLTDMGGGSTFHSNPVKVMPLTTGTAGKSSRYAAALARG